MNNLISQQMPLIDAGISSRNVERHLQPVKVAAVDKTGELHQQEDASVEHENDTGRDENIAKTVKQINIQLQAMQRSLRFSVDDASGRIVVKVIDLDTDEVIRQIPSEEMLALAHSASGNDGLIINEEA